MFQNPDILDLLAAQRRKELLAEAEQWRMCHPKADGPKPPSFREKFVLGLAEGLIRAGTMIQASQRQGPMQS